MDLPRSSQKVCGWVIVAISGLHVAVTFVDYDAPSLRALWFVGSGFALLLIGALNVITSRLSGRTSSEGSAIRALTTVGNTCGIALGLGYVWLTNLSPPQGPVLVALFLVAASSQFAGRAARP